MTEKIIRFNVLEEINVLNESLPSNEASITLDNRDGEFNILTFGNMVEVLASRPTVFIEAGLITDVSAGTAEWVPLGKFFITEWKNDLSNRVITFTCHDYFYMLSDTSYGPNVADFPDLLALATDVLNVAGVENRIVDNRLSAIKVNSRRSSSIEQIAELLYRISQLRPKFVFSKIERAIL